MSRGGYRPGAGRPKGLKAGCAAAPDAPADIKAAASSAGMTPLEYMLSVMRDRKVQALRRDRMAIAAAPFIHPRKEPASAGKKEERAEAAQRASVGRFAPPEPPKLVVDNG